MRAFVISLAVVLALAPIIPAVPAAFAQTVEAKESESLAVPSELGLAPDTDPADPMSVAAPSNREVFAECCKTCRKGKACGDSCIQRTETCEQPPGCACDGE